MLVLVIAWLFWGTNCMIYFKQSWKKFLFYCDINKKRYCQSRIKTYFGAIGFFTFADKFLKWGHLDRGYFGTFGDHTLYCRLFMHGVQNKFLQWNMINTHVHMKSPLFVVTSKMYHKFLILKCPYGNIGWILQNCHLATCRYL